MNANKTTSFVESISDSEIHVVCRSESAVQQVKSLGGRRTLLSSEKWKLRYDSEAVLAAHLSVLRDAEIAMAGALGGWPPAAVFEQLREQGKLSGKFVEIMWKRPGEAVTAEK